MIERELPSDPSILPEVRERVREWCEQRGWSEHQIGEIVLAIDEALSNVIRHGYRGRPDAQIKLKVLALDAPAPNSGMRVEIRDFCENVDLGKICGRDLDDVRPGGLGVHLIHAMMESVSYRYAEGGGVLLTMEKSKRHTARGETQEEGPP